LGCGEPLVSRAHGRRHGEIRPSPSLMLSRPSWRSLNLLHADELPAWWDLGQVGSSRDSSVLGAGGAAAPLTQEASESGRISLRPLRREVGIVGIEQQIRIDFLGLAQVRATKGRTKLTTYREIG
jgi:hypothetical protein